jgi:hypothetical protein
MSKIVLIAYHSNTDSDVKAAMEAQNILIAQMESQTILNRFEVFDVVDSLSEKVAK